MSQAELFANKLGWEYNVVGNNQINVLRCPFCGNDNYKFYMCTEESRDGLFDCKVCSKSGNLYQLKKDLNMTENITSLQDVSISNQIKDPIPDIAQLHWNLLNNEKFCDVLDYLVADRGFSIAAIEKLKLGAALDAAGVKWAAYPYFNAKNDVTYVKYRTVPPAKKTFRGLRGRENPLYNSVALNQATTELIMVEGEGDVVSLISNGVDNVVGIPGAAMKKAEWIEALDAKKDLTVYTLYDSDLVGQKAAKEMATRIGLDRVKNILLPEFKKQDGSAGKDINEWCRFGLTSEQWQELKDNAKPFHVDGVQDIKDVLRQLSDELTENGVEPTLKTQWPSVNRVVGGFEFGDLVGILADGKIGKSTTALNLCDHFAKQGHTAFMYCNEMKPTRMIRKWVSYVTQTDDTPNASKMSPDIIKLATSLLPTYKGDLLFGFTNNNPKHVMETIRQAVRRYGVKVACFDNLQMLVKSEEHATQETSNLTKKFKELAMELNILLLLLIQPKRIPDGKIVSARDAYGSSAIEKDVDCMICLHRNRIAVIKENDFTGFTESAENFESNMLVRADLTRYAPGGSTTLWMDGATSTVKEFSADMVSALPKDNSKISLVDA
jgi:5S rRNA maturation endonuclease (ribonuclease M5)/archaellum biogenesis ATPase FlaH